MAAYLLRRLFGTCLLLLALSLLFFTLIGLMPGDPLDQLLLQPDITDEDVARLKAIYGLNQPLLWRYGQWLVAALQGEFGFSRLYAAPVAAVLWARLDDTLLLMGLSLLLAIVIAVPLGVVAASTRGRWPDHLINLTAFAGISLPSFWLALLLIILFAVQLGWLPASGSGALAGGGLLERLPYLVLPVLTLTLLSIGTLVRFVRSAMIDALSQPYIRTAYAKGAPRRAVLVGHALRNALLPVVTVLALDVGTLLSGSVVVETIFAWPGIGKLTYDAVLGNDYNLALLALLLASLLTLLANLLADLLYTWLDPRIDLAHG